MARPLQCNIERNLKPTLEFFLHDLSGEAEEVRDIVTSNPRLLGASIEKRLRPRVARMLSRGVVATFSEHRWVLAIRTDAFFDQWVEQLEPQQAEAGTRSSPAAAATASTRVVSEADTFAPAPVE